MRVRADTLNFCFLSYFFIFFHVEYMLRFDVTAYLWLFLKFSFIERLSNSLWGSDVSLFLELRNIVSILFYNFIEFIILLYNFLETSFPRYKEYIFYPVSFSMFWDVFTPLTCASGFSNLWSICWRVIFWPK